MKITAALLITLAVTPVLAAPAEVQNLRWSSPTVMDWDNVSNTQAYHLYGGDLTGLPGNADCLVGNHRSESLESDEAVGGGQVRYYLVVGLDESGEGPLGNDGDGTPRSAANSCKPSRRSFEASPDGDQADGVVDGDYPLRNPSMLVQHSRRESTGVFLHTGEFFLAASDMTIRGRHLDWAFERTYRSQVHYDGPLGHNWDFNLNARLTPLGTDVRHHDGSGRIEIFGRIDSTHFASPPGRYAVLIENPDGSFTLREPHGLLWNFHAFDGSNLEGALATVEDRFGDVMTSHYDHQGLLVALTDSLGRRIDLAYDPNGRLTSFTDFAGRSWVYSHDAEGDLVSARSPVVTGTPNGNDFPAGKTTGYAYSSGFADERFNHCMLSVVAPNEQTSGVPWIQTAYFTTSAPPFDQGRVDSWTIGGTNASGIPAGGTIDFGYESLNPGLPHDNVTPRRRTTILDANGNQRRYVHNRAGNRIEQTLFTNREVRLGEPDYTTTWVFNDDGEVIQASYPEGNQALYTYDTPGADRYREGNLLEARRVADTLSGGGRGDGHGGELNDVVGTYSYDPVYNLLLERTEPRGNDSSYTPQNGGLQSADRYTTQTTYCHQEGDPATTGLNAYAGRFDIDLTGLAGNLGDVNGDSVTDRIYGTPIRVVRPEVALDPSSNQAAIEGDTSQDTIVTHIYNPFAQRISTTDAEANVHLFTYYPEDDPDGDGTPTPSPLDGRTLDGSDGGYQATVRRDTASAAARNNGTDPPPADVRTDLIYDPVGNIVGSIDGRGVLTRVVRNALNEIVELRRAAATSDATGPDGDPATGRGEAGLAAFSFKVNSEYDANGNLVARRTEDRNQDHGAGTTAEECIIWDIKDSDISHDQEASTGLVLATEYRYDANANLIEITQPEGNTHLVTYDERDLPYTKTRGATGPRGGSPSTRTYDYDGNGNVTQIVDGRGNALQRQYDGVDRLTRAIDQVGNTVDGFYDPAGNRVRVLRRGPVDGSSSVPVDLSDIAYLFDEQHRRFRTDRELFVPAGATPGRTPVINEGPLLLGDGALNTIREYDRAGRLTFVVRDTGTTTRTDHDGLGRMLRVTSPDGGTDELTWDGRHNLIELAETELPSTAGPAPELFLTTHFYDALGRREMSVDNLGLTTRFRYSSLDRLIQLTDPNGPPGAMIDRRSAAGAGMSVQSNADGNVTDYVWDAAGRRLREQRTLTSSGLGDGSSSPPPTTGDPFNTDGLIAVDHAWDDNSLQIAMQDDNGNTTAYGHDNLNRRVSVTYDDATQTSYVHDGEHNVIQHTDPNGSVMTHAYDAANRRTQLSVNPASGVDGTGLQLFEYDGRNLLTRATDNNMLTDFEDDSDVRRVYDSLGRIVEEKQSLGSLPTAQKLIDPQWTSELMTAMVYPSGRQIDYGYDAEDRLDSVDVVGRAETASYDWLGMSRLATRGYGNGVRMTMLDDAGTADIGWDGTKRITSMRHLNPTNTVVAGFEHGYDRASNRTHELRLHDELLGAGFQGELWGFSSANWLTSFHEDTLDSSLNPVGPAVDTHDWAFDGVGNPRQTDRNGTVYNFSANNLNEFDDPQSGGTRVDDLLPDDAYDLNATPVADGQNRSHDKNGNRTGDPLFNYVYDFHDRLVRVVRSADGAPIGRYAYDAFNRRVSRQVTNSGALDEIRLYLYTPAFHPEREMKESGEKGGTQDINIGIGELNGDGHEAWITLDSTAQSNNSPTTYPECCNINCSCQPPGGGGGDPHKGWITVESMSSPLSNSALIEERGSTDAVVREIFHAQGTPLWQIRSDSSSQYFHEDPRGNVVALTEGAGPPTTSIGDVLERYSYDPYGKPLFQNAANVNKVEPGAGIFVRRSDFGNTLLFQGMVYDPETDNRGTTFNSDSGGLYCSGGRYLDPDDGRYMTRSGVESDPGVGILKGGFHDSGDEPNRYMFGLHAPVNQTGTSGGLPQPREHILLGRQVGVPLIVKMKRVMVTSVSTGGSSSGKDKATPNLMKYCVGGKHSGVHSSGKIWTDHNSHDPGAPSLPPTLASPEPEPIPAGIEHEDIGGGDIALPCVCVMVPVPCGSCPSGFDAVLSCSSGCGHGGSPSGPSLSVDPGGSAPSEPQTPRGCVCIVVPILCPSCPGGYKMKTFCGGSCGGGGGGGGADFLVWQRG